MRSGRSAVNSPFPVCSSVAPAVIAQIKEIEELKDAKPEQEDAIRRRIDRILDGKAWLSSRPTCAGAPKANPGPFSGKGTLLVLRSSDLR
jgi:hypothetical protein